MGHSKLCQCLDGTNNHTDCMFRVHKYLLALKSLLQMVFISYEYIIVSNEYLYICNHKTHK